MKLTLIVLIILLDKSRVEGGGSISIYQSTSSVPPLAESFSEGSCVIPQTSRKLDPKWVIRQSTFYIPLASQFTYRLYAETFLSRAGVSEMDVKSMCLTLDFFPDGPGVNVTNTGFDLREFKQTCPVIWRGQFTCLPVGGSPGTNSARARSTDNYVVSVDNQSYMLVVRCVDGFFKDYMLLTTRPIVSPELYHTVMTTIKELGFDPKKLMMVKYDNCVRTDRFVTAVNVHHHSHHHHHVRPTSNLRPSYNPPRRITISSPPITASIVGGSNGGGRIGPGQTSSRVQELEAFYAIIP
ncbi:unnamed protein product [Orchesella dallaii]|uniref:Lipocalin n=1 Tax=Orchesella dallaii TaxID=48710 RepID=A0ABP1RAU0_9HEXA